MLSFVLGGSWPTYLNPAHLFIVAAFFILLLVETGRMPICSNRLRMSYWRLPRWRGGWNPAASTSIWGSSA